MKDTVWIYPGSFDPLTYGHIDIIRRAAGMCGTLIVAVLVNKDKSPLFSTDVRVKMIHEALSDIGNIKVECFSGLQADFFREQKADAVVHGLRSEADYAYELTIARTNKMLNPDFESVFLLSDEKYNFVASSSVRTIASYGGAIDRFVPPFIEALVKEKYKENYK